MVTSQGRAKVERRSVEGHVKVGALYSNVTHANMPKRWWSII